VILWHHRKKNWV